MAKVRRRPFASLDEVERQARIVFDISGGQVERKENPDGKLCAIVVIGPGLDPLDNSLVVEKTLLAEISFRRTRPYNRTRELNSRKKEFCLSPEQYQLMGGPLWREIVSLTEKRVGQWENPVFALPVKKNFYFRSRREMASRVTRRDCPRGIRFKIDKRDSHILDDLFWAEWNLNDDIRKKVRWLSWVVSMCLARNTRPLHPRRFCKLRAVENIQQAFSATLINAHLWPEVIRAIPEYQRHPHIHNLADMFDWDLSTTEATRRRKQVLPNAKQRLGIISLKILQIEESFVVFEVYPDLTRLLKITPREEVAVSEVPF